MGILEARMAGIKALIEKKKAIAEDVASKHIQNICYRLLYDAAVASPQWSGDYASNWNIVSGRKPRYDSYLKVIPWQNLIGEERARGDELAVELAIDRSYEPISKIRWNMKIRLVNTAPIADELEAMEINLRPVNRLTPDVSVISFLKMKYRCIP